ncbi:hypothetical protein JW916_03405 [Candidatus Sumerlaeota bacterium]|nr:hypothetical protein [Candidatus Sumerlaeota bacterium]
MNSKTTIVLVGVVAAILSAAAAHAQRVMENLGRGVVAVRQAEGKVYVGWRLLAVDPDDVAFNLYRVANRTRTVRLNDYPIVESTNFVDETADLEIRNEYYVRPVIDGEEQDASGRFVLHADTPERNYIAIPLRGDYSFNRMGVGDLDGDGEYDYVVKQPDQVSDPGRYRPSEDTWKIEAYRSDGTFLWRRDLGWNIEQGVWWSPFVVYDLDSDGRAEVIAKTAPTNVDYRGPKGSRVSRGPEWFSVFDGTTGVELARANWIARGKPGLWGDSRGNRANRNLMCVAYLDGERPSVVIFRGTYALMKAEAWDYRDGRLKRRWKWSNEGLGPEFQGQGFHNLRIADVDGDGRDEILNGAILLDDDGRAVYSSGEGHGDRCYLTDIDPDRPGYEIWYCHESSKNGIGVEMLDARTGRRIFGPPEPTTGDVGRAIVEDIDPRYRGLECWSRGGSAQWLFDCKGNVLGPNSLTAHLGVWWDDDLLREIAENGRIQKWDWIEYKTHDIGTHVRKQYSEKMVADVLGDWREEIMTVDRGELRIYTTPIPSTRRFYTFMQDPVYRLDVACMSMGYTQSCYPSFYFGDGMAPPPRPNIVTPDLGAHGRR